MPRVGGYRKPYKAKYQKKRYPIGTTRTNVGKYNMGGGAGKEKKYFDSTQNIGVNARRPQAIPVAGKILPIQASMNLVPQGSGASQRDGRKITVTGLRVRGTIKFDQANWLGGEKVRLMLVHDMQCNGTAATAAMLLDSAALDFAAAARADGDIPTETEAFMELANQRRFRILKDKTFVVNAFDVAQEKIIHFKLAAKWRQGLPINFNAASPTISGVRDNNLFILCFKQGLGSLLASNEIVEIGYLARLRYFDT